jgi:hypothetical protein
MSSSILKGQDFLFKVCHPEFVLEFDFDGRRRHFIEKIFVQQRPVNGVNTLIVATLESSQKGRIKSRACPFRS